MTKLIHFKNFALLLFLTFISGGIVIAQNANFTINKDSAEVGSTIVFKNTSTGFDSTVYYVWTLFNGSISYLHPIVLTDYNDTTYILTDSVSHLYETTGTYSIRLIAYNVYNSPLDTSFKGIVIINKDSWWEECENSDSCDYICDAGFEEIGTSNAYSYGLIGIANQWMPAGCVYCIMPALPDIFTRNATNPKFLVPLNTAGDIQPSPSNDNNYIGVVCYADTDSSYREYAQTLLTKPLIPNQKYVVGMRVSLAANSSFTVDSLGIYLSIDRPLQNSNDYSFTFYSNIGPTQYLQPQIKAKISNEPGKWFLISDTIIGNKEMTLTLGNFNTTLYSQLNHVNNNQISLANFPESLAYYFVDSVFIEPIYSRGNQIYEVCYDDAEPFILFSSVQSDPDETEWIWSNNAIGSQTSISHITSDTTIYCTAYYVDENANEYCPVIDTFNIVLALPPDAVVNNPVIDCGDSVTLTVTGSNIGSYLWSTNDTTQSIIVHPQGTTQYTVTVTNALGCSPVVLTSTVSIPPAPAKPELNYFVNNICDTTNYTFPYSVLNPVSGWIYQWQIIPQNAGYFNGVPAGTTTVTGTNVTITWIHNNFPPLPSYVKIKLVVVDEHKCSSFEEFRIFECCKPWGNDPPEELIDLSNTDAATDLPSSLSPYSNQIFLINGNFFVNQNLVIESSDINMGPEASIIVMPGYDLVIDSSALHASCNFMWKGIVIDDNQSNMKLSSNSINDAYVGIDAKNKAKIEIENNTYTNNNIGIRIQEYVNPIANSVKIYGNIFQSSLISGNYSFYPPMNTAFRKPFAGVVIEHSNNISVGNENFNINIFNTLYNGIRCKNSDINIYHNQFENIKRNFGGLSLWIINEPYGVGVYSVNTIRGSIAQGITIGGSPQKANAFTGCDYGVYLHNNRRFMVSANSFDNNKTGIFAGETFHFNGSKIIYKNMIENVKYCGIEMQMMKNCSAQFNEISEIVPIPSNQNSPMLRRYGINGKGCLNTRIYGNWIHNTSTTSDLRIEGICTQLGSYYMGCNKVEEMGKALNFYGNNSPSTIELNQMANSPYGIYLNHGYIGNQGWGGHPSDNQWIWTISNPGGFTYHTYVENHSTGSDIFLRGYTNPNWTNNYFPSLMNNGWMPGSSPIYFNGTSGTGHYCEEIQKEVIPFVLNREAGEMIFNGDIAFEENVDFNQWMSEYALFNSLVEEDPESYTDWMKYFMTYCDENFKTFHKINEMFCDEDYYGIKEMVDQTEANSKIAGIMLEIYKMISESTLGENNASDDILFYDYQVEELRQIASECPYVLGYPVYMARMLLSVIEPTVYHNECEDMIEERNIEKPKVEDNICKVKVYPNPARDEFTIELVDDLRGKKTNVELYNLYGNIVKNIVMNLAEKISINTVDLSSGIYFYKVSLDNNIIGKDKIVLIK